MNLSIGRLAGAASLALLLGACSVAPLDGGNAAATIATRDETSALAADVYVYAYPLVLMDVTREVTTAGKPAGTFTHERAIADPKYREPLVQTADTLYSTAWLDLSRGPVLLSLPDMHGRPFIMPVMDAWTNVFATIGRRAPGTAGTGRASYALTGPGWKGTLPDGVTEIRSPTAMVWLTGRSLLRNRGETGAVVAAQNQFRLAPLPLPVRHGVAAGAPARVATVTPAGAAATVATVPGLAAAPVDTETEPGEQVASMDAQSFFSRFAALLPANPPTPVDPVIDKKIRELGVQSGAPFSTTALEPERARAIQEGATRALGKIQAEAQSGAERRPEGWSSEPDLGRYGTQYLQRAASAMRGPAAVLQEDVMDVRTSVDGSGFALDGARRYVLHFTKEQVPRAQAGWSLTLYDGNAALVDNPLRRFALGSRDNLLKNRDGSFDILVQRDRPKGARARNWLPAPVGPFSLVLRAYAPERAQLDEAWSPPAVTRQD